MGKRCNDLNKTASGITYQCLRPEGHEGRHQHVGMTWENLAEAEAETEAEAHERYGVYEDATGVLWTVNPDTRENAEKEALLVGEGHRAVPVEWGDQLRNAYAKGRLSGIKAMRGLTGGQE